MRLFEIDVLFGAKVAKDGHTAEHLAEGTVECKTVKHDCQYHEESHNQSGRDGLLPLVLAVSAVIPGLR